MPKKYVAGAVCLLLLAQVSCSTVPDFELPANIEAPRGIEGPTVASVVKKIQCEVGLAAMDNFDFSPSAHVDGFEHWQASVSMTLTVNDNFGTSNTTGVPISYIDPVISKAFAFSLNASPVLSQNRQRTFNLTYTIDIESIVRTIEIEDKNVGSGKNIDLKNMIYVDDNGLPTPKACIGGFDSNVNLAGDLGLRSQIFMGLHSFDGVTDLNSDAMPAASRFTVKSPTETDAVKQVAAVHAVAQGQSQTLGTAGASDGIGATVAFHIYKGVNNLGPTWSVVTFKGPTAGLQFIRDDLHQIAITFKPEERPASLAQEQPVCPHTNGGFVPKTAGSCNITDTLDGQKDRDAYILSLKTHLHDVEKNKTARAYAKEKALQSLPAVTTQFLLNSTLSPIRNIR